MAQYVSNKTWIVVGALCQNNNMRQEKLHFCVIQRSHYNRGFTNRGFELPTVSPLYSFANLANLTG
jgi:hypothetical protein